jgi:hypothetical protein
MTNKERFEKLEADVKALEGHTHMDNTGKDVSKPILPEPEIPPCPFEVGQEVALDGVMDDTGGKVLDTKHDGEQWLIQRFYNDRNQGWVRASLYRLYVPPAKFKVGDPVRVQSGLYAGEYGIIVDDHYSWRVDFGNGVKVWISEDRLEPYVPPAKFKVGDAARVKPDAYVHPKLKGKGVIIVGVNRDGSYEILVGPDAICSIDSDNLTPYLPLPGEKVVVELTDGQKWRGGWDADNSSASSGVWLSPGGAGHSVWVSHGAVKSIRPDLEAKP